LRFDRLVRRTSSPSPQRSRCTTPRGENIGEQPINRQNCAIGTLDRSHWAIRSAQIWAVFEDAQRDISRISLRTGIETRAHLEFTRKQALRLEKDDQAGVNASVRVESVCTWPRSNEVFNLLFSATCLSQPSLSTFYCATAGWVDPIVQFIHKDCVDKANVSRAQFGGDGCVDGTRW
jgi:hypothetical protein